MYKDTSPQTYSYIWRTTQFDNERLPACLYVRPYVCMTAHHKLCPILWTQLLPQFTRIFLKLCMCFCPGLEKLPSAYFVTVFAVWT